VPPYDPTSAFGQRVERRLASDIVGWLVTVGPDGGPVPVPVWFLRVGDDLLVYSKPGTAKLRSIAARPLVAFHLDGDGRGGDIVVVSGEARESTDGPADQVPAYVEKYADPIAGIGHTPATFATAYSVPLRIAIAKVRGH
jgi:PPOX class probable F420-dependent enzyme